MVGCSLAEKRLFLVFGKCQEKNKQLTLDSKDFVQTFFLHRGLFVGYVKGDFTHSTDCFMQEEAFTSTHSLRYEVITPCPTEE